MMSKKTATIILNRNLPIVTDNLVNHLKKYDGNSTDIFVIEVYRYGFKTNYCNKV